MKKKERKTKKRKIYKHNSTPKKKNAKQKLTTVLWKVEAPPNHRKRKKSLLTDLKQKEKRNEQWNNKKNITCTNWPQTKGIRKKKTCYVCWPTPSKKKKWNKKEKKLYVCQTQDLTHKTQGTAVNRILPRKPTAKLWYNIWCHANILNILFGTGNWTILLYYMKYLTWHKTNCKLHATFHSYHYSLKWRGYTLFGSCL